VFISGCDSGFGKLSALQLSRKGCTVLAGCYTQSGKQNLLSEKLPNLIPFDLDITNQDSINNAVKLTKKYCKEYPLWALINNAGIGSLGLIDLVPVDTFRTVLEVNFFGHVSITQQLIPLLKKSKGRIINTASIMGRGIASPGVCAYIVSKRALEAFNDCLRIELRPWEVRVSVIEPGYMNTDIIGSAAKNFEELKRNIPKEKFEEYGEEYFKDIEKILENLPRSRMLGNPQKVSDAYVHAVLAIHPKQRYLVGNDAWLVYSWLALLPSWLADFITLKIQPQSLPAILRKKK